MALPRIWLMCPDYASPSGGIRKLYRQADILNQHGHCAAILHDKPGFRCQWFPNDTRIEYQPHATVAVDDIVVVPEIYGVGLPRIYPGIRKVVFSQNCYLTFAGCQPVVSTFAPDYSHPDVAAVLTISADSQSYLRFAFPTVRVERIRYGVDATTFVPRQKARMIAYMPRKNFQDATQVVQMPSARGTAKDFAFVPIDQRSEAETAALLGQSAIFLSFGHPEGFGLPTAEALASGCWVIGYDGFGGREFLRDEWSQPIAVGDIVAFVQVVEEAVVAWDRDHATLQGRLSRGRQFIIENYSMEIEVRDVLGFWSTLLP